MTQFKRFVAMRQNISTKQYEIYSQPLNPKTGKAWQADTRKGVFDNPALCLLEFNRLKKSNKDQATEYRGFQQSRSSR